MCLAWKKIINGCQVIAVGRVLSALRLRPQTPDGKRAVSTVAQMGGRLHLRECEVEERIVTNWLNTTFKGSDELCLAGDRIELVRFLSTLIH